MPKRKKKAAEEKKSKKPAPVKQRKLSPLDEIVKICKERGITYGQYQQEEYWQKVREEREREQKRKELKWID